MQRTESKKSRKNRKANKFEDGGGSRHKQKAYNRKAWKSDVREVL